MSKRVQYPTQALVAEACRVSRSAVAAVLSEKPSTTVVSPRTRTLILEKAEELGYRRHFAGLSLLTGRTHTVAIAIPSYNFISGVISVQVFEGIIETAAQMGYSVTVSSYREKPGEGVSFAKLLRESRFDGFFFFGDMRSETDERAQICAKSGRPYVILEKFVPGSPSLIFDNFSGGRLATEHLLTQKRRRIAFVGNEPEVSLYNDRFRGYCQAMQTAGLAIEADLTWPCSAELGERGRASVRRLIDRKTCFDGLVCVSDYTALGCIQLLHEKGLRIPEDVAVVGYDNSTMAEMASPTLTSIHQDGLELGRQAMRMLGDHLAGKNVPMEPRIIPVQLVVRKSSEKP